MEKAPLPMGSFTGESGLIGTDPLVPMDSFAPAGSILSRDIFKYGLLQPHSKRIVAYSWLKHPDWLLVLRQDFSEVFGDINKVKHGILILLHSSVLAILIVSVFGTRYMINAIKKRTRRQRN